MIGRQEGIGEPERDGAVKEGLDFVLAVEAFLLYGLLLARGLRTVCEDEAREGVREMGRGIEAMRAIEIMPGVDPGCAIWEKKLLSG